MNENLMTSAFNIKSIIDNNSKKENILINKEVYNLAETIVKNKVINQKGSVIESQKYNEILAKCVLGDKKSTTQMKEFIKQYLIDSKKFTTKQIEYLIQPIYQNNFGLGAIDDLVEDTSINEIWVNGYDHVWIEKNGIKKRLDRRFKNDDDVIRVMRQMLQFDKKEITSATPIVESKLLNGSRITFAIPPASSRPCINIRKFEAFEVTEENLLNTETITKEQLEFFKAIIKGRTNILVIGETGSGKTSFLKFLCNYINPNLRIGTVESNLELKLTKKYPDRNIFEYESHEELGVDLGVLFRLCLRSSPDIILLGEARGSEETEALINSMRRGHPGSIGTIHTNSPSTAVDDLIEMILEDGRKRDPLLLKHRIVNAIEIIIQIHRFDDGKRKIVKVTEIVPSYDDSTPGKYEENDIWVYNKNNDSFNKVGSIKNEKLLTKMKFYGLSDDEIAIL